MFKQIIGHHRQCDYFKTLILQNRLSHAYCFKGVDGIGKCTFAIELSKVLLCAEDIICQKKCDRQSHPDLLIIKEESTILTEQVVAIQQFINTKPYQSNLKVVIVDDAGQMIEQAQNKLLKLLEEPQGHALIIFITNKANKLLKTVRSRMIDIDFSPLTDEQIKLLCQQNKAVFDDSYLSVAMGSFGQYLKWSSEKKFKDNAIILIEIILAIVKDQPDKWLSKLSVLDNFKNETSILFNILYLLLQDFNLIANNFDASLLRLSPYTKSMVQYNKIFTKKSLQTIEQAIDNAKSALERGQNYALISEGLLFKIQEAIHG